MTEINTPEVKTGEIGSATTEIAESSRSIDARKMGQLVLEGLGSAKKVGEAVAGFFYFLSPVPKEFNFRTFKTHPDPIIKTRAQYS